MKSKEILTGMVEILKSLGYNVRKDNGTFNGGACILKEEKIIVLNRNLPIETQLSILSNVLYEYIDKIYIQPKIREFVEREGKNLTTPIEIVVNK